MGLSPRLEPLNDFALPAEQTAEKVRCWGGSCTATPENVAKLGMAVQLPSQLGTEFHFFNGLLGDKSFGSLSRVWIMVSVIPPSSYLVLSYLLPG
jgi:hypothetical protein